MKSFVLCALSLMLVTIGFINCQPLQQTTEHKNNLDELVHFFRQFNQHDLNIDAIDEKTLSEDILNASNHDNEKQKRYNSDVWITKKRARTLVLNNVYNTCIYRNYDPKTCLYLANLYHNVKGYHGI
jgi:hypothetical protein